MGESGATALFDGVTAQRPKHGYIARSGQIIDATRVPTSKPRNSREENKLIKRGAMPTDPLRDKPRRSGRGRIARTA